MSVKNYHVKLIFKKKHIKRDLFLSILITLSCLTLFALALKYFKLLNAYSIFVISFFGSILFAFLFGCYIDALNGKKKDEKRKDEMWSIPRILILHVVVQIAVFTGIFFIFIAYALIF